MLLKVGDYQDEQEILSGNVTRKIGIKVLDGTENWTASSNYLGSCYSFVLGETPVGQLICSHFQNTSSLSDYSRGKCYKEASAFNLWYGDNIATAIADLKQFLADQYAAGTPVIVVYPLNASTTETVSPQKLLKNPVTVTEASIDNLEVTTTEAEHTVPTPDYPLDIVCNNGVLKVGPNNSVIVEGTPETVTITGKNLFNESHIKSVAINDVSVVIPVKQNKTYTWSYNKTEYDFRFDSDFVWGVDLNGNRVENGVTLVYANGTYTTASYVTVTVVSPNVVALQTVFRNNTIQATKENVLASNMQLEEGIRPTKYEEYYQASFAPEDLLKLSDYQDVQRVLDGIVARNIGIKVLDGTENWTASSNYLGSCYSFVLGETPVGQLICSHFQNTSSLSDYSRGKCYKEASAFNLWYGDNIATAIADLKQFLADQYAAGTPVIVVYPLNASTTETVSPQKLLKNPVTVTEASIDNLEVTTTEAEHTVPTPDYPLDIVCNNGVLKVGPNNSVIVEGTPETVTITGKNLFNESHIKSVAINDVSVVIPVKQNKTYTWSYNKTEYDFRFDSDFVWGVDLNGNRVENGVTLVYANGTYTTASYVTVTVVSPNVVALQTVFRNNTIQATKENVLASNMQLEEGIRPTKYEEYYQASFAPEDLLKLSDYQDVQRVLDGIVARNIGIKVLDGTENWTRYGTGEFATPLIGSKKQDNQQAPISTHFIGMSTNNVPHTDGYVSIFNGSIAQTSGTLGINYQATPELTQFKQWLADQYAAGTPVIVVYPLADTVEETVESRDVFITSGTNTIERSSEYVASDGITVKYKKLR